MYMNFFIYLMVGFITLFNTPTPSPLIDLKQKNMKKVHHVVSYVT